MTASPKSAGIISKPAKPEIAKIVPELLAWFRERGYALVVDPETAPYARPAGITGTALLLRVARTKRSPVSLSRKAREIGSVRTWLGSGFFILAVLERPNRKLARRSHSSTG